MSKVDVCRVAIPKGSAWVSGIDVPRVSIRAIRSRVLRERIKAGSTTRNTALFIAKRSDKEAGLLSVDLLEAADDLEVYEIFVLREHRGCGVESFLLKYAEELAVRRGNRTVLLKPLPLDTEPSLAELVAWYKRCGYATVESDSEPEFMRKQVLIDQDTDTRPTAAPERATPR
jgi:GNAT superfamily N-acetyltransferase